MPAMPWPPKKALSLTLTFNHMAIATPTLIGPFTQLLPMQGLPVKGPLADGQLPVLTNAGIITQAGKVVATGPFEALQAQAKQQGAQTQYIDQPMVALPGFIDSHTHICYAGSRAADYALRNSGTSYIDIAKKGGGIRDTMRKTRGATQAQLANGIVQRCKRLLNDGVCTIEVKSGYGLSLASELKMLRAINQANAQVPARLISTCLAAHTLPPEYDNETQYLQHLLDVLLPEVMQEQLSQRVDIFIEESAFSVQAARHYLTEAQRLGFDLTVHADQFSTGGAALAVALGAVSADHLEASGPKEVALLAASKTVATALPGATLGLGCPFTPARRLLDAGGALAIASDWNPGSAPMGNLLVQACLLGTFEKLSNAEVLAGITCRAAAALGMHDRGTLAPGQLADFTAFATTDYREITYNQGSLRPSATWVGGKLYNPGLM